MSYDNIEIPQINLSESSEVLESRKTSVIEQSADVVTQPVQRATFPKKRRFNKQMKIVSIVLAGVGVVLILLGLSAFDAYKKAKVLVDDVKIVEAAVNAQNITQIKSGLDKVNTDLVTLQKSFNNFGWVKVVPIAGAYWRDGDSAIKAGIYALDAAKETVVAVEPYADIIGFTGDDSKKAKNGEENANDRIEFLVATIEQIVPKIQGISEKAQLAKREIDKIDPNRYPNEFRGVKVREKMTKAIELADEATAVISNGKPLLEQAPYFLGIKEPRTYLVLFQNDKELRPTGGFLTAYSIMKVSKGKMQPVASSDIYSLDAKYRPSVPAPDEFRSFIAGPYSIAKNFFLRDLNWYPDFKNSMDVFTTESKKTGITQVDGIIAVDTNVLVKLLNVLGEIGVPGFGNFSDKVDPRCNCPQVIYELENFADVEGPVVWSENDPTKIVFAPKNYGKNRKEIVGPLMNSVLSNALGQPKDKLPGLFQAGWEALTEKHVLFYMFDPKAQAAVESFGIAGRVRDYQEDYLFVNDANLGGRKSNLYVTTEVSQDYTTGKDGYIEKTVTLTYKNPQAQDGWLNSVLPNWTRVYVPKGSQLISMDGFEQKRQPYEEYGKTVFAGGFKLRPLGVAKITIKYKLPIKAQGSVSLLVQKQPGTDKPLYSIHSKSQKEDVYLLTDKEFKISL
jgi:hypothetical protein